MGKETLAEANRRIEQSEALDLFDSDRLGLFVVSRLAARHDVKVHLRTSPYGGTTAVVLLPTALLHTGAPEDPPAEEAPAPHPAERAYARVPDDTPLQDAVPAQADRRALVAPVPAIAETVAHTETTSHTPPSGVATLRLHRPQEQPEDSDDLPRRVRQASLAPQLRDGRPEEPPPTPAPRDDERTPELVRDRMAAYRDGWARGGGRQSGRGATPGPATAGDSSEGDPA
jgi:hypothetical protein